MKEKRLVKKTTNKTKFLFFFFIFIGIEICLACFIFLFHKKIPFYRNSYFVNAHHYKIDKRILGKNPSLFELYAPYDGQWFLKIAEEGYPKNPTTTDPKKKDKMDGLMYGYFPFYPLVLSGVNYFAKNTFVSGFIIAYIILFLDFYLLFQVVAHTSSEETALKSCFLLFYFPFSVFYRMYYSEGLFLLLLLLFVFCLQRKKYIGAGGALSLLLITRGIGMVLPFFFLFVLYKEKTNRKIIPLIMIAVFIPFILWCFYNWIQTGNYFYFLSIRGVYTSFQGPFFLMPFYNAAVQMAQLFLPQPFLLSIIGSFLSLINILFLVLARKTINKELWAIWFCLTIFLFLTTPTTWGFGRYSIVIFPLFYYSATVLRKTCFVLYMCCSFILMALVSLSLVNWCFFG